MSPARLVLACALGLALIGFLAGGSLHSSRSAASSTGAGAARDEHDELQPASDAQTETRIAVESEGAEAPQLLEAGPATEAARSQLELQVVTSDGPVRKLTARLHAGSYQELAPELRRAPADTTYFTPGEDGVLRFADLEPGPYRVVLDLEGEHLEQAIRILAGQKLARIVIRLGAATVEGVVYDDAGLPVLGARVRLARHGYGRNPPPFECFAETDERGYYRIEQVGSGPQVVAAFLPNSTGRRGLERECQAPFQGSVRVDFGSPREGVRWSGVLRNSAGEPVPGPGELRIHEEDQDGFRTQALRADGSFELRLQPGRHHLWVQPAGFFPRQVDLGSVVVPGGDLERDLVLPGARLTVVSGSDVEPRALGIRLASGAATLERLVPAADGTWIHDGLEPGDYLLDAGRQHFLESGTSTLPVLLTPGAQGLSLVVHLVDVAE